MKKNSDANPNILPRKLSNMIKMFKFDDALPIIKMSLAWIPGKIWKLFQKDIWVITELSYNARDNGYWLFKYIKEHYPEKKVYYAIDKKSSDYKKVSMYDSVVQFESFKHCMLFWACSKYASTYFFDGVPFRRISVALILLNLHRFKYVFLNHGMARGFSAIVDGKQTNYSAVIAASEQERQIIIQMNNQPKEKVYATGFCRFDNLNSELYNERLVLIMPTWREKLQVLINRTEEEKKHIYKNFKESNYYQSYISLLNNQDFIQFIEKNNLKVIFYLHRLAQNYRELFYSNSANIEIVSQDEYFVQDLLKEAAFLITDYSSVYFDYGYMKKPMLYYQFDLTDFEKNQYSESSFYTYADHGFGPVFYEESKVINYVKYMFQRKWKIENKYMDRIENYFDDFEPTHTQRIFDVINQL